MRQHLGVDAASAQAGWNIMDALIIVVSLVETTIDIWAQAGGWDDGRFLGDIESKGHGDSQRLRDEQQPIAFGAKHSFGAGSAGNPRGAALPLRKCIEVRAGEECQTWHRC